VISLDGQFLLTDNVDAELEGFIRRYISAELYQPWLRRSWPGFGMAGLTYPLGYRGEPSFKLNRFHWPSGASRWAYGHFMAGAKSCNLDQIINDAFASGGAYNPVTLKLATNSSDSETLSTQVYLMPPVPVSYVPGANPLYLLTVVDVRFFWWYTYVGDLNIGNDTTWANLFGQVAGAIGIKDFQFDSINSAYLQPSTMFNLPYETAPQILDAVAWNVGQRIIRNYDGSVRSQSYQTALNILNSDFQGHSKRQQVAGGEKFSNPL
jgi:hypothetical protein